MLKYAVIIRLYPVVDWNKIIADADNSEKTALRIILGLINRPLSVGNLIHKLRAGGVYKNNIISTVELLNQQVCIGQFGYACKVRNY